MHVPNEVHDLITWGMEVHHLQKYRLIHPSFARAANRRLFAWQGFSIKLRSLKRLAHIASHEHLSRHVQSLDWYSLEDGGSGTRDVEVLGALSNSEWKQVRDILAEGDEDAQEDTIDGEECPNTEFGMRILTMILRRFTNFKYLNIRIWHKYPFILQRPPDSLVCGEYEMQTLLTAAHAAGCSVTEFSMSSRPAQSALFRTDIWPTLSKICGNLTSLEIPMNFAFNTAERDQLLRSYSDSDSESISESGSESEPDQGGDRVKEEEEKEDQEEESSHGTELATLPTDESIAAQATSFQSFLSTLTNLQILELDLSYNEVGWEPFSNRASHVHADLRRPLIEDMFPPLSAGALALLRKLELDCPSSSTLYLKAFLTEHKATLRVVKLSKVRFATCGRRDRENRYPDEGCIPLQKFMEEDMKLEEQELDCWNCACVRECYSTGRCVCWDNETRTSGD
jgi:hypothetical protein